MSLRAKIFAYWMKNRPKSLSATKIIAIAFAAIIFLGACLLNLPAASRSGEPSGFLTALFTATSATCVTGLVVQDTWLQWSGFGQCVILLLIQVGGLGFMSAATLLVILLRKRIGLKQRLVMAQALSISDMDGIVRLQKTVLVGSFLIEGIGALILFIRFLPEYGLGNAFRWSVFHSVSAFCNAGFDIFGVLEPDAGLILFQSDLVVLLTLCCLIVIGGLGFLVWQEVQQKRSFRRLSVYARLVLLTTFALIVVGWIILCLLEWDNPRTLGPMSVGDKLLNGLFQSVTLRTAGFASIDQAGLTEGGKAVSIVWMLIGGSSGSTAGGLKTVSFVVLILFMAARARGRESVCVFRRTIPQGQVLDAMTIGIILIFLAIFGGIFISSTSDVSVTDGVFEAVSALATVGLTAGATRVMSVPAKLLIILYMYFGRVGVLTISLGFLAGNRAEERYRYAETKLLIG